MRIRAMELFKVPPRWLFLKITTEDGITGWGEMLKDEDRDRAGRVFQAMMGMVKLDIAALKAAYDQR